MTEPIKNVAESATSTDPNMPRDEVKEIYTPPALKRWGTVTELTESGGGGAADGGSNSVGG